MIGLFKKIVWLKKNKKPLLRLHFLPIFCYRFSSCQQQSPILIEWGKKGSGFLCHPIGFWIIEFQAGFMGTCREWLMPTSESPCYTSIRVALFAFPSAFWLNWHPFAFCGSGVIFCWQCLVMVTDWCPCGMGRSHWLVRCINAGPLNDMQTCLCAKWQLNGCQWERLLSTDKRQHLYSLAMSLSPIWGETFVQDIFFFSHWRYLRRKVGV